MWALLNWRIWAAVALAIGLAASHWKVYNLGKQVVQTKWDQQTLQTYEQVEKLRAETAVTQALLEADKEKLRRNKNAEINKLNADLTDALERLRNRPERPREGDLPADTGAEPAASCTGAGLYREDAEFLTREADRADQNGQPLPSK